MGFKITLTWSKLVAVLVLGAAVVLDLRNNSVSTFMFALPFVVFMITGKQLIDKNKK